MSIFFLYSQINTSRIHMNRKNSAYEHVCYQKSFLKFTIVLSIYLFLVEKIFRREKKNQTRIIGKKTNINFISYAQSINNFFIGASGTINVPRRYMNSHANYVSVVDNIIGGAQVSFKTYCSYVCKNWMRFAAKNLWYEWLTCEFWLSLPTRKKKFWRRDDRSKKKIKKRVGVAAVAILIVNMSTFYWHRFFFFSPVIRHVWLDVFFVIRT